MRCLCFVYCRSFDEPYLGFFAGNSFADALSAAYDKIVEEKISITDSNVADATDAAMRGDKQFVVDDDGISFVFLKSFDGELCENS